MIVCILEVITLQSIVYLEGERVIIVKDKCHVIVLSRLRNLENTGCFRKLSTGGRNECWEVTQKSVSVGGLITGVQTGRFCLNFISMQLLLVYFELMFIV